MIRLILVLLILFQFSCVCHAGYQNNLRSDFLNSESNIYGINIRTLAMICKIISSLIHHFSTENSLRGVQSYPALSPAVRANTVEAKTRNI